MRIKQQEAGEWEPLQEDVYEAEVTEIEEKDSKYGVALSWQFTLIEDGVEDRKVWGMTSTNLVNLDRCKLWSWIKALGVNLKEDQDLDTDSLLGKPCRILVENYEGTDGIERSRVKEVLGSKRKQNNVKLASKKEFELLSEGFSDIGIETPKEKLEYIKGLGIKNKPNKLESKDVAQILRAIEKESPDDKEEDGEQIPF